MVLLSMVLLPIPLNKLLCALPSFGDWIGDVMGQFPMNFSDVKPDFMVQVKKY